MKIAITGGTGFIGRHLARELVAQNHEVVLISRGHDARDSCVRELKSATFLPVGTGAIDDLARAFQGCDAIAHCAGINREIGEQTYQRVHVENTRLVVEAAKRAGAGKIALLSFIRARAPTAARPITSRSGKPKKSCAQAASITPFSKPE
jgi:nucleoside-diphosphate-sugar epimerase